MKNTFTLSKTFHTLTLLLALLTLGTSCKVAEKRLRQGDYVEVLNKAIQKLQNNPENSRYILLLEDAHMRIMDEELSSISYLKNEARDNRWIEVMHRYERLEHFQSMIRPLLPLYIPNEYRNADIQLLDLSGKLAEARNNSAAFLHGEASTFMNRANQTGNKQDFRAAYDILDELTSFMPGYKNSSDLRATAYDKGLDLILIETINACGLPSALENNLRNIDVRSLNTKWMKYSTFPDESRNPDFLLLTRLTCVESSPDFFNEIHTEETKKVVVRHRTKKDKKGNPVLDSLGNTIRIPVYGDVTAKVIETHQRKNVKVAGEMQIYRSSDNVLLRTLPLESVIAFENCFTTATGNLKGLSDATEAKLGGGMLPYPSEYNLLRDATAQLGGQLLAVANSNCHLFN